MGNLPLEKMLDSKVIATAITTAVIGWLVAFAAKYGVVVGETEIALAAAVLAPVVAGLITLGVGWLKSDARVKALLDFYRRVTLEGSAEMRDEPEDARVGENGMAALELAAIISAVCLVILVVLAVD